MKRILLAAAFIGISLALAQDIQNPQTDASKLTTGTLPAARMPALTGDVTTSAGAVATTLTTAQAGAHTWAAAQTFTVAPVFTDAPGSRTALGLGTAATVTLGANVGTFLTTPTSANLAAAITDETGTGAAVFGTSPTIATPTITGAWTVASNQTIGGSLTVGDGTTAKVITISGATSGSGNGTYLSFHAGVNLIGEYSALQGGAYDSTMLIFNSSGAYRLNALVQTSAAQSGTMCYSTTVGAITYDASLGCLASSMRFKHDWKPLTAALDKVLHLETGSFFYNDSEAVPGEQIGLNAENMATVDNRLVAYDKDGSPRAVRYINTIALLVRAIQEQQEQINTLKARQ